jgi:hypothetical protein
MAFAYTKNGNPISMGNKMATFGTYTNGGGDTGGAIYTGLQKTEFVIITPTAAVSADQAACTTTLPASDPITIVTTDGSDGQWMAIGY